MSDAFLAEIRMFSGNFAPTGWALCNGQVLSIAQNSALFALLGATYGGNGQTTFALPNLQARAPMHWGQGPGLSMRYLGESAGAPAVTLLSNQMPPHTHQVAASGGGGAVDNPVNNSFASAARGSGGALYATQTPNISMGISGVAGNSDPHNNMQPYLALTFIIALQGIFPQRP